MVRSHTRSVLVCSEVCLDVHARTIELYKPCLHVVRTWHVRLNTLNIPHVPRPRINAPQKACKELLKIKKGVGHIDMVTAVWIVQL